MASENSNSNSNSNPSPSASAPGNESDLQVFTSLRRLNILLGNGNDGFERVSVQDGSVTLKAPIATLSRLVDNIDLLIQERDGFRAQNTELIQERDGFLAQNLELERDYEQLELENGRLERGNERLERENNHLRGEDDVDRDDEDRETEDEATPIDDSNLKKLLGNFRDLDLTHVVENTLFTTRMSMAQLVDMLFESPLNSYMLYLDPGKYHGFITSLQSFLASSRNQASTTKQRYDNVVDVTIPQAQDQLLEATQRVSAARHLWENSLNDLRLRNQDKRHFEIQHERATRMQETLRSELSQIETKHWAVSLLKDTMERLRDGHTTPEFRKYLKLSNIMSVDDELLQNFKTNCGVTDFASVRNLTVRELIKISKASYVLGLWYSPYYRSVFGENFELARGHGKKSFVYIEQTCKMFGIAIPPSFRSTMADISPSPGVFSPRRSAAKRKSSYLFSPEKKAKTKTSHEQAALEIVMNSPELRNKMLKALEEAGNDSAGNDSAGNDNAGNNNN